MPGTKNSGRKKIFKNKKQVHFFIEQEEYDKLIEVMKNDGYNEFSRYMRAVVGRLLE
ncbi:unnamed protein product [marine sediment metagenome]|uniref:Uncharacterized protein n=1 Tax=marine sediment metagenome TaxID=412755 RepID=X0TUX6_9ZZZZ